MRLSRRQSLVCLLGCAGKHRTYSHLCGGRARDRAKNGRDHRAHRGHGDREHHDHVNRVWSECHLNDGHVSDGHESHDHEHKVW